MAEILLGERKLTDLKVTELKAELDKRGLPKKGVKSVLVERLKKAILKEELSNVANEGDGNWTQSDLETSLDGSMAQEGARATTESKPVAAAEDDITSAKSASPQHEGHTSADAVVEEPTVEVTESSVEAHPVSVEAETATQEPDKLVKPITCEETVAEEVEMVTLATAEDSETSVNVAEGDGVEEEGEGREEDGEGDYEHDIHEEELGNQQPMELGSPLDSDPEFDLTGDLLVPSGQDLEGEEGEGGGEEGGGEGEREGEEEEQVDREEEKAEEDAEEANAGKRMDRLDSNFDSSYQPGSEELLYEGDPDNEVEMKNDQETGEQAAEDTSQAAGEKAAAAGGKGKGVPEKREEDEEFMLEVHYKDQGGGGGEGLEEPAPGASSHDAAEQAKSEGTRAAESARSSGCHLWVAGLVASVRALDLQTLFSRFGQVLSAKVVAKAHSKVRFGYVTVATPEQAQKCIKELNGSELKGNTINVEMAKTPPPLTQPAGEESKSAHRGPSVPSGGDHPKGGEGAEKKEGGEGRKDRDKPGEVVTKTPPSAGPKGGEGKGNGGRRREERRRTTSSGGARSRSHERQVRTRRSPSPSRHSPRGGGGGGGRMRGGRHSPPPHYSGHHPHSHPPHRPAHTSRDARHDIIRREEQRRDLMERRLGADPYYRDGSRQVMMDERRLADRYQAMAVRRQLEMEHSRREQEMARRMEEIREREARERELKERQLAEQERMFKERERVMREREYRERQRREQLEKELRERDQREKELRERERRLREQHVHEMQEREMKAAREREMRQRELQAQMERERELREKEQRLMQEHQRIQKEKQMYEEQQRRLREEAERQAREREREREREEKERERRIREEKERRERAEEERVKLERERDQKRKQDELKWEREREREREREHQRMLQQQQQQQRLGKRSYQDSGSFDPPKRQAMHDLRGNPDLFDLSSSVFSRLDPQKQAAAKAVGQLAPGVEQSLASLMQGGKTGVTGQDGYGRRNSGGASGGGVAYRQGSYSGVGRERRMDDISYPISSSLAKNGQGSSQGYSKGSNVGGVSVVPKGLSRANQDIITAALANIQKSVHQTPATSLPQAMRMPGSSVQQISPGGHLSLGGAGGLGDFVALSSRGPSVGQLSTAMVGVGRQGMHIVGSSGVGKPMSKLPPEQERYNRRFSRPSQPGRQTNYKRLT